MSVRANWHSGVAQQQSSDDSDPFENMNPGQAVLSADSPPSAFKERWHRVINRLNRLEAMGVTCPLREGGECHCSACPVSQISDPDGERHQLCSAGVEEERLTMLSRIASLGELAPSGV